MGISLVKKKQIGMLFLIICALGIKLVSSLHDCQTNNSLTPQQNSNFKQFTSSAYLPIESHTPLIQAYSSLESLDNYLIQISNQFVFLIDDVADCVSIPSYVTFTSMDDIWLCFSYSIMILECNKQWQLKIGCGTMIEVHRPFDSKVLGKTILYKDQFKSPVSISVAGLCAGSYHLWFVYSTRVGKVIKSVRPIFISYPPCDCE